MNRLSLKFAFFYLSVFSQFAFSLSPTYLNCQRQKLDGESALTGCPKGTLYVSPTDSHANFTSVQNAIDSLPETGRAIILIGEGQYSEMINVTRSAPLTLLGQLDASAPLIPAGNASQRNLVQIWNNRHVDSDTTDEETATLTVTPALYHPFGNVNFKAYNIDFENRADTYPVSRALVTSITLSNASFYGCSFSSWQDTWFTGYGAHTYAVDSTIYGQVDYIFGLGHAWFQSVTLANRGCGSESAMTAWQGTPGTRAGAYIADSRIIRSPDANTTTVTTQNCNLGRPWNIYAVVVFLRSYMDDIIHPAGFIPWGGENTVPSTTYYAEFDSHGPGGDMSARVSQDHILQSAENFTLENVFLGIPSWIDSRYQY